ncbi:hypothetical protein JR316_0010499 [Psilocybe cubensis]|uniref:Uncharacterized protein n=2 Tax=Psilocybe cubensis TaxID=181762 RepID=A0A8H8CDZ7_PSICU|nr:hypothetical protein JR316_0010499 [Psilocybe cubensis]KAH9476587.1 hypothetical protein JR316_0010499 [Psilocybe cubensis]
MPNPGIFKGACKEFLLAQKGIYADAVKNGHVAETLMAIQRRYFKRFPVEMPLNQDPTPEALAAVNDNDPDEDVAEPDRDLLSEDEYNMQMAAFKARQTVLIVRKGQLRRWFAYQYARENGPKMNSNVTLLAGLLQRIYNPTKESQRPRLKAPVNVWRKSQREAIDRAYENEIARAKEQGETRAKANKAADRDRIARTMFQALSIQEQAQWKKAAQEEHDAAMEKFKAESSGAPPSTDPRDCQRSIQSLPQILQPILDAICAATGWKATLIAGGPEPARGGHLSVISLHSGLTSGDVKMNFGQAERVGYKKHIIPIFGSFLHKCYSKEECQSRSLPEEEGLLPMADLQFDEANATVHALADGNQNSEASGTGAVVAEELVSAPSQSVAVDCANGNPFPVDLVSDTDEGDIRDNEPYSRGPSPALSLPVSRPPSPSPQQPPSAAQVPSEQPSSALNAPVDSPSSLTAAASSAKGVTKAKKGKKKAKPTVSKVDRPKRKAPAATADSASAGVAPPPKKKTKHSWHYEDEFGRLVDKEGRRIDAKGNIIPPERLDAFGNEIVTGVEGSAPV